LLGGQKPFAHAGYRNQKTILGQTDTDVSVVRGHVSPVIHTFADMDNIRLGLLQIHKNTSPQNWTTVQRVIYDIITKNAMQSRWKSTDF
jgi:hypothetical protein